MSKPMLILALALGASAWTAPLAGQGVAGTWQITTEGRRGTQTQTLVLEVDGSTLTGTITFGGGGRRGGGRGPGTLQISNGTLDGDSFGFEVELDFGGNSFTISFSGTVDGDTMEGTRSGGRGGGAPFTGARGG